MLITPVGGDADDVEVVLSAPLSLLSVVKRPGDGDLGVRETSAVCATGLSADSATTEQDRERPSAAQ
jgi:hypothetical protein